MTGRKIVPRSVSVAAAVNNRAVLDNCLRRSPDIRSGALPLQIYEGARSASRAYNRALEETNADIVVFAHQDVYLPSGFHACLLRQIAALEKVDPNWAFAGAIGLDEHGGLQGRAWSTGLGSLIGDAAPQPVMVETLDEMLLVVRRASGVRFDEQLPGFHLYAADAVQIAKAAGLKSYVIDTPAIHHSRAVVALDRGYRQAYRYMQVKWRSQLPLPNLVCTVTRSPVPLLIRDLRLRRRNRGKQRPEEPRDDPSAIAQRLGFETTAT